MTQLPALISEGVLCAKCKVFIDSPAPGVERLCEGCRKQVQPVFWTPEDQPPCFCACLRPDAAECSEERYRKQFGYIPADWSQLEERCDCRCHAEEEREDDWYAEACDHQRLLDEYQGQDD
jgi:hypothetical protein